MALSNTEGSFVLTEKEFAMQRKSAVRIFLNRLVQKLRGLADGTTPPPRSRQKRRVRRALMRR